MQVDFYQLGTDPIERVLPRIAERILEAGGRLLVVTADRGQTALLDEILWTYAADSFLPHGLVGDGAEAGQPVLIGTSVDAPNGARHVALADGVWRDEALTFDRVFHFFDEATVAEARIAWKALVDAEGLTRNYWRQNEDGRWEKMA